MEQARSTPKHHEAWKNGALEAVMKIILNPSETERNYNSYLNSLQRYSTFEEGLRCASGRDVELLMSGSMAECLFAQHWVYKDGTREAKHDIDIMLVDFSLTVVEKRRLECPPVDNHSSTTFINPCTCRVQPFDTETPSIPSTSTAPLQNRYECGDARPLTATLELKLKQSTQNDVFLEPSNHPGYTQLYELDMEGKPALLSTEGFRGYWSGVVNKTALYSLVTTGPQLPLGGVIASGPALNRRDRPNLRNNYAHDYVPCLRCPKWPTMADRWVERKRTVEWPSKGLVSHIVSKGCHIVPVSHHDNDNQPHHTEWRLSFSSAEKSLVHSLSLEQRQSYIIAKLIMKQVVKELKENPSKPLENTLSSYHFKTILLWKCEEKAVEEWNNLLNSVVELLQTFVDHLNRGTIPNYFIPENNMISHIKQQDLTSVANGIAASLDNLPMILHNVFLAAYETVLDFDDNYSPVLRLVDCQLKIFSQTGVVGEKLYLYYILNSVVDSLSDAITGTSDELRCLEDHKHILHIYCTHQIGAGSPLTLPATPVLVAAEASTTVTILFQYLHNLLQDNHILTCLQTDIFAILSRTFSRTLPSLALREQLSHDCCEASLNVFQNVCEKLGIAHCSDLSSRDELSTLSGVGYIFFKYPKLAEQDTFKFTAQRFQKFQNDGQLEKVKSMQW